jgi:uncharacterized protein YdeI (YjbR/CyaY-like superfamily)
MVVKRKTQKLNRKDVRSRKARAKAMPTFFESSTGFRAWLETYAATESELIVGFHKRASKPEGMTWSQSVDEALCFGWIDGVRTRIDDHSYKIRFTPRKPSSIWSAININKVGELRSQSKMMQAGLTAFERRSENKSRIYAYEQAKRAMLEPEQEAIFRKNRKAWAFFLAQAPSYRHRAAWHVTSAKRAETRAARLAKVIKASANGVRI